MTQEDILHIKEDGLNAPLEEERGNYGHKGPFWYFTTHGVQPGSVPNDVHIIEIRDGVNNKGTKGTFVALDGVLTAEELKYYDMKEMSPRFTKDDSLNESSFTRDTFKVKDGDSEIVVSYEWDKDNTWHTTVGEFKDGFQVGALWFNKYYPTEEQAKNSFNRQKYLLKKLYPEKTIKEDYQVLSTSDIDLSDNVDDEGIDLYYKQWRKLQKELAPKERNLYILVVDDYDVPSPHYYSVAKLDKQTKDYLIYDVNGVKVGFTDKGTESPWLWFASEEDANKYVDIMNAENESLNEAFEDRIVEKEKISNVKDVSSPGDWSASGYVYTFDYNGDTYYVHINRDPSYYDISRLINRTKKKEYVFDRNNREHWRKQFFTNAFSIDEFVNDKEHWADIQQKTRDRSDHLSDSLNIKSNRKDLREAMRYWFTFDDGTEIPAENEEQAIELYSRLWKNRRPKQVRSKEELDKIAQSLYDKNDEIGFYDFNDEELAILWSMCVLRKDGTGGRAYDDEVYDTISLLPHKQRIFDRAEEIVDEEEKSFLTKEQNDKLDKAISDVVKTTEQPKKALKESPDDEIKIFMNTWANYNENGADISQYGFENMADGWLSIDDAIEFAEKYADDEPFINDTDNVPAGFDINEYSSVDVLNDLKEYEELDSYDKEALSAIMEATGDDFESAKEILDSGDWRFYKGIDNFTDLAYEIIDELGGLEEALGDRVSNYIDEDAMRRAYEWDIRDSMRDDAENAVEEDHYGELTTDDFDNLPKEVELDIELSDYDDEDELNDAIRDEIAYNLDLDFDVDDLETAIESFETETTEDGKTIAKNIVYNFETYDKDAEIEDWIDDNIDSYLDSIIEEDIYLAEKGELDLSDYFDYEAYGRDLSFDGTFTIVDGGIIELY